MILYKIIIKNSYGYTLDIFTKLIKNVFLSKSFKINILPKKIKKYVFLKSPHIYKKSMEYFEARESKRLISCLVFFKDDLTFFNRLKLISWSFWGVSLKIKKLNKQCYYLK